MPFDRPFLNRSRLPEISKFYQIGDVYVISTTVFYPHKLKLNIFYGHICNTKISEIIDESYQCLKHLPISSCKVRENSITWMQQRLEKQLLVLSLLFSYLPSPWHFHVPSNLLSVYYTYKNIIKYDKQTGNPRLILRTLILMRYYITYYIWVKTILKSRNIKRFVHSSYWISTQEERLYSELKLLEILWSRYQIYNKLRYHEPNIM